MRWRVLGRYYAIVAAIAVAGIAFLAVSPADVRANQTTYSGSSGNYPAGQVVLWSGWVEAGGYATSTVIGALATGTANVYMIWGCQTPYELGQGTYAYSRGWTWTGNTPGTGLGLEDWDRWCSVIAVGSGPFTIFSSAITVVSPSSTYVKPPYPSARPSVGSTADATIAPTPSPSSATNNCFPNGWSGTLSGFSVRSCSFPISGYSSGNTQFRVVVDQIIGVTTSHNSGRTLAMSFQVATAGAPTTWMNTASGSGSGVSCSLATSAGCEALIGTSQPQITGAWTTLCLAGSTCSGSTPAWGSAQLAASCCNGTEAGNVRWHIETRPTPATTAYPYITSPPDATPFPTASCAVATNCGTPAPCIGPSCQGDGTGTTGEGGVGQGNGLGPNTAYCPGTGHPEGPISGQCKGFMLNYAGVGVCIPITDPLNAIGWVGCVLTQIATLVPNAVTWVINGAIDLAEPGPALGTAVGAFKTDVSGRTPFNYVGTFITDVTTAVTSPAGTNVAGSVNFGSIYGITVGTRSIPTVTLPSGVYSALSALLYLAGGLLIIREAYGAVGGQERGE